MLGRATSEYGMQTTTTTTTTTTILQSQREESVSNLPQ